MMTMIEAKAAAKKNLAAVAGQQFSCPTGAIGIILPELSAHGKIQAELTCTEEGCSNTHIREISDWHQCGKCLTHAKPKKRSGKRSGKGIEIVDEDGNKLTLRELKVLDTDDEETRAMKEENNALVAQLKAQRDEQRKAEVEAARAKREQEREAEKVRKAAEAAEAAKRKMAEQLERAKAMAQAV